MPGRIDLRLSLVWLIGLAGVTSIAGLILATPASAQPRQAAALFPVASRLPQTGFAKPMAAWTTFCQNYPGECVLDPATPTIIQLDDKSWAKIDAVNAAVNHRIKPRTDLEHLHVADRWDLAEDGAGDCEDYQLLKRKLLVDRGLPRRAMRMTVVIDEHGEGHAVLSLITDRGEFILDNKTDIIRAWDRTGYVFIKRESQDSATWVSLGGWPHRRPRRTGSRTSSSGQCLERHSSLSVMLHLILIISMWQFIYHGIAGRAFIAFGGCMMSHRMGAGHD